MTLVAALSACLSTERGAQDDEIVGTAQALSPMIIVRGLEEPLVPTKRTTAAEDHAVRQAVSEFRELNAAQAEIEDLIVPLEQFVEAHPHSGWTAAVLTDLGIDYYHGGYFTRAFDAWEKAWAEGRDAQEPKARALVDRAVGELARMHARVGHEPELLALFNDIGDRHVSGPATELLSGAMEGAYAMHTTPGIAYLCGPKALGNTLRAVGASKEAIAMTEAARSGVHGFSLAEVARLANSTGMGHRLIYRSPGQTIPVPSVINWKVHHYASIDYEKNGRYHVKDPTFGGDLVISRAAIDAEGSGYFLVPAGVPDDPAWRDATPEEAERVYGMGFTTGSLPGATDQNQTTIHGGGCSFGAGQPGGASQPGGLGMCVPDAHAMAVSVTLNDTPVGYSPQVGPDAHIRLTYNQREAGQPANPSYFNISQKWTLNVLSYVEDDTTKDPATGLSTIKRMLPGGGYYTYEGISDRTLTAEGYCPAPTDQTPCFTGYNTSTGAFNPELQTGAVLSRTPTTGIATSYTLTNPDGSQLLYTQSDGGTNPRRMFLKVIVDPQGNRLTLAYDSSLRLTTLTDAVGRVTTFSYGLTSYPLLVTRICDPASRCATLGYGTTSPSCPPNDPMKFSPAGLLTSITDAIGITSSFCYDDNKLINRLDTPYGSTSFNCTETITKDPDGKITDYQRSVEITDPIANSGGSGGGTERVEFRHNAPGISDTDAHPQCISAWSGLAMRNTFYWDKYLYAKYVQPNPTAPDYTKAKRYHWVHSANQQTSPILESTIEPGENRVWYNYANAGADLEGAFGLPTATARLLDDGSGQLYTATYNSIGNPLSKTEPTRDCHVYPPVGRITKYSYYPNNIDLQKVERQSGSDLSSLVSYGTLVSYGAYNSQHRPASMIDAAGKTWNYAYNAKGQRTTVTDPLGKVTTFNYTGIWSQLTSVVNANNVTVAQIFYQPPRAPTLCAPNGTCDVPIAVRDSEGWQVNFTYDRLDRVTRIIYPDNTTDLYSYTAPDGTPRLELQQYTDRLGRVTKYTYDANQRLVSVTDPNQNTVQYTYFPNDRLNTLKDQNGNVTTWTLDDYGRVGGKKYQDGKGVTYTYEVMAGRLKTVTDALGQVKTLAYNPDNSVASITYVNTVNPTPNVSFTYDPGFPRRATMMDGNGTTTWSYVPLGNKGALSMLKEDGPFAYDDVTYGYDELGRVVSRAIAGGSAETWVYDAIGRRSRHLVPGLLYFDYGFLGQTAAPTTRAMNGTNYTTWSYDTNANDRRLIGMTNGSGARSFTFSYQLPTGPSGTNPYQVTSTTEILGDGSKSRLRCYQYDLGGRLLTAGDGLVTTGDCTQQSNVYTFVPDAASNLLSFAHPYGSVTNSTYNNLNQAATSGTQTLVYDSVGNLLSAGARVFKWDAENRLIRVDAPPKTSTFRYDGLGRRVEEVANDGNRLTTQRFTWCGDRICAKRDGTDAGIAGYFDEGYATDANSVFLTIADQVGSTRDVIHVMTTGTAVGTLSYSPYGEIETRGGPPSINPDFVYAGLYQGGIVMHSATRVYDPTLGRWISRDTIGEAGGVNLYAYVGDDPVNRGDPSGKFGPAGCAGGALIGALVGGIAGAASASANALVRAGRCKKPDGKELVTTIALGALGGAVYGCIAGASGGTALAGAEGFLGVSGLESPLTTVIPTGTRTVAAWVGSGAGVGAVQGTL